MGEERQQPGSSAGTPALDGAWGDVEDAGGLGHRVALHVHQYERRPLIGREGSHRGDELPVDVAALGRSSGGLMGLEELLQVLRLGYRRGTPGGGLAGPVQARIDGDAVEPGRDGGLSSEGVGGAVGGHQGVLDRVGGLLAIPQRAEGDRPQPVAMASDEFTEGTGVTRDMPGEKVLVARRIVRRFVHRLSPSTRPCEPPWVVSP